MRRTGAHFIRYSLVTYFSLWVFNGGFRAGVSILLIDVIRVLKPTFRSARNLAIHSWIPCVKIAYFMFLCNLCNLEKQEYFKIYSSVHKRIFKH